MELRDSTKRFLDALATLCEIYGVTKVCGDEDGGAKFVIGNGVVVAEYCKPVNADGQFYGIREATYANEYRPEIGGEDNG